MTSPKKRCLVLVDGRHEDWRARELARQSQERMLRDQAVEGLRRDDERRRLNRRLIAAGVFFLTFLVGAFKWL